MALRQIDRTESDRLVAGEVTTIQCRTPVNGFRVFNRDPVESLYCRVDKVDPTVGGDGSFLVPPLSSRWFTNLVDANSPEIRLISAGLGLVYTVEADFTE